MVGTKLINLTTHQLEEYAINQMPLYIAISHVWAEALFPPIKIGSMSSTDGMKLVVEALRQFQARDSPMLKPPAHCWIDTWSIDQNDAQDKQMQIPAMGDIYRGAELVVIVTSHQFSFVQQDWELALGRAKPVFMAYFQYFEDPSGALESLRALPQSARDSFGSLARMVGEIASIPWATRIWTAQEYILAKAQCWIGANKKLLCLAENDMDYITRAAELFKHELATEKVLSERQWQMLSIPQNMHLIKSGVASPLKAMSLARDRHCLMPKDQIYGLMGATGVVIKHEEQDTLEIAWQKWCEAAVSKGHIDILYTAAIRAPVSLLESSWNCAMPTWKDRCDIFHQSYLPSARCTSRPSIDKGTTSLLGKVAGLCLIDRYLCSGGLPTELEDLAAFCGHDLVLAEKVCCAEDGGVRPEQEVKERAKAIHAAHVYTTKPKLMEQERIELQQVMDDFSAGILSRYGMGTHIYLARLVNACNSRDIFVFTDEDLYEDEELLALDLADDQTIQQPHPVTQLVVARAPPKIDGALHKAGTTSLVKLHYGDELDVDKCGCEGYAHTATYQELKLGGSNCWYCKELKQSLADQLNNKTTISKSWPTDHIECGNVDDWCKMDIQAGGTPVIAIARAQLLRRDRTWLWLILAAIVLVCSYLLNRA